MWENRIMYSNRFPYYLFDDISRKNPYWSSWTCFYETIKGKMLSRRVMTKAFDKLVDKKDYAQKEKFQLLNCLISLLGSKKDGTPT